MHLNFKEALVSLILSLSSSLSTIFASPIFEVAMDIPFLTGVVDLNAIADCRESDSKANVDMVGLFSRFYLFD